MREMSNKGGKPVRLVPIVSSTFPADGVAPVGFRRDPLPVHPCLKRKEVQVYQLGKP